MAMQTLSNFLRNNSKIFLLGNKLSLISELINNFWTHPHNFNTSLMLQLISVQERNINSLWYQIMLKECCSF